MINIIIKTHNKIHLQTLQRNFVLAQKIYLLILNYMVSTSSSFVATFKARTSLLRIMDAYMTTFVHKL